MQALMRAIGQLMTFRIGGESMPHSPRLLVVLLFAAWTLLLMFVYVFGGAIDTGGVRYVDYLLPGILLITVASGVAYTALRLFVDVSSGIFERFQSMPIARSAVLWGHVVTSVVANLVSLILVVLVAVAIGFRSSAGVVAWLAVLGIVVLFTLALTDTTTGTPVTGAVVRLEGNMSHPGMTPALGEAREIEPGRYQAQLDLDMAGDWFLVVDATLPDGRLLHRQVDLPGVRAQ